MEPAGSRGQALPRMGGERILHGAPRGGQKALYHRNAAAKHNRPAAHGSRAGRDAAGRAHALSSHEGRSHAVAARHRSRLDRDRGKDRRPAEGRGPDQAADRPRGIPQARLGLEEEVCRPHNPSAAQAGRVLRLDPPALHDGRGLQQGG